MKDGKEFLPKIRKTSPSFRYPADPFVLFAFWAGNDLR